MKALSKKIATLRGKRGSRDESATDRDEDSNSSMSSGNYDKKDQFSTETIRRNSLSKSNKRDSLDLRGSSEQSKEDEGETIQKPAENPSISRKSPVDEKIKKTIDAGGYQLELSAVGITDLPEIITTKLSATLIKADLGFNKFVNFPAIWTCANLIELTVDGNEIIEIPNQVSSLTNLRIFSANGNKISKLPKEIASLGNSLEKLSIANNQIDELPNEIGKLLKLEELNLSGNMLTNLTPYIGNCARLEILDLSGCQLTRLPVEFTCLTRVMELNLGNNKLEELPWSIGKMTRLCILNISDNKLTDLSMSIGYCIGLNKLGSGIYLERNPIADSVMVYKSNVGTDHLQAYLEDRLHENGNNPDWSKLKEVQPLEFPSDEEVKRKEEYEKFDFQNDLESNPELSTKMNMLRQWGSKAIIEFREKFSQKHISFMTAVDLSSAKERSENLLLFCKHMETARMMIPPQPMPTLKMARGSDTELVKFTKEIDNEIAVAKVVLNGIEKVISVSKSSKQILSLIQIIKNLPKL